MLNYYTVFDLDNQRVGFASSNHVDQVSYWYDILYLLSLALAIFGTIAFIVSCYRERRDLAAERSLNERPPVVESEMIVNPSSRS